MKSRTVNYLGGDYQLLSKAILEETHVLIGGTTRAGKSVLLNTVITDSIALGNSMFYFIDLKQLELVCYKDMPSCMGYANTPTEAYKLVKQFENEMNRRMEDTKRKGLRKSDCVDSYLVIDEYVDVKISCSKDVMKSLYRIASMGGALKMHLIICTQRPTREIIDGTIKANLTGVIAVRTKNAQESRNLLGISGAELLNVGCCLTQFSKDVGQIYMENVKMYDDDYILSRIRSFKEINPNVHKTVPKYRKKDYDCSTFIGFLKMLFC